ncbi:hypothetical protein BaRGS_00032456 [Batillaria attramentaria]|uniref:Uncharacterized protein n=1 Tax=Batillaria attramentaria TaxID=370345 RepID=A0ABD0JNK7_9CAEN
MSRPGGKGGESERVPPVFSRRAGSKQEGSGQRQGSFNAADFDSGEPEVQEGAHGRHDLMVAGQIRSRTHHIQTQTTLPAVAVYSTFAAT